MTRSEWDPNKDKENRRKHGVAFASAQFAFADPSRVIAEALSRRRREAVLLLWSSRGRSADGPLHVPRRRRPNLWRRLLAKGEGNL